MNLVKCIVSVVCLLPWVYFAYVSSLGDPGAANFDAHFFIAPIVFFLGAGLALIGGLTSWFWLKSEKKKGSRLWIFYTFPLLFNSIYVLGFSVVVGYGVFFGKLLK